MEPKHIPAENPEFRRSQSLNSLPFQDNVPTVLYRPGLVHRTYSESSVEVCAHSDNDERPMDSGICDKIFDGDMLAVMEQKIDRLSDMFLEQCRLLTTMKEEIRGSKMLLEKTEHAHNQMLVDMLKTAISQRVTGMNIPMVDGEDSEAVNSRAKALLSAIESRKEASLDSEIRATLVSFLQSEELKEQMVRATAESVRGLIGGCFSRDMSKLYLPVLERSHRRLIAHIHTIIEQAFVELEEKFSSLFKSMLKTSGALRRALERHQNLLEATSDPGKNLDNTLQCTIEELLEKELREWRHKVADILLSQFPSMPLLNTEPMASLDYAPVTPPQPADPEISAIDQLMQTAMINKQIQDGDVNGSFERALSAGDLSLVMAACRAVDPTDVFGPPCRLQQHVMLSLVQQLATDMVHETQLKCRYIAMAIVSLDVNNQDTRAHLPLIVGEVRKHLTKFLTAYPNHVAGRRITLIVMAANNLLN
uniref:Enhancer of mRNA-decapping protein 4 C-terminal domain-containing protein n=1 Tax=Heliothis virescens TaxID=7102 RepID=A0A2A4JV30_HELVI